jgi:MFS family permease
MSKSGILAIIVIAQFFCTSTWFAGNAVLSDLIQAFQLKEDAVGVITTAVQLGFIAGTLTFAILTISDRFSPVKVFFLSAIAAAGFNTSTVFAGSNLTLLLALRFLTGFSLAGIYPVGMKIASDHFDNKLGKALGFLVGALVVGTALPHLVKGLNVHMGWMVVFKVTSILALTGGIMVFYLVPDGPHRTLSTGFDSTMILKVFRGSSFRSAAFGYFGHMWELYAFWAFVPIWMESYNSLHKTADLNIALTSFLVIGLGGIACVLSGFMSQVYGSKKTATGALMCSGLCCLFSPLMFYLPLMGFISFLIFWGLTVIADSPMFSTLVAFNAPAESKGTALTIVNSIGFSITIASIWLLSLLVGRIDPRYLFVPLVLGPVLGLYAMLTNDKNKHQN